MNKLNQIISLIYFKPFLTISFGIFLFILFFQPFSIDQFDFNNRLIFVAGLGGIIYVSMLIVKSMFFIFSDKEYSNELRLALPNFISGVSMLAISSVGFAFYLKYVGNVSISFYVMLKIILICLTPPVLFRFYDSIRILKQHNEELIKEKKSIQKQVEKYQEDYLNKTVLFGSESGGDTLNLPVADVAFVRSADNYVEIVYKEGDAFKKKLIRNTLKGIERQIKDYTNFIRCHRICIVNSHFIENLSNNYSSHWIAIKNYEEKIPVSRQYLLKIREVI